jgi:hypothetical protein
MVTRRFERLRCAQENVLSGMLDERCLSMHQAFGAHDFSTEDPANALVAQTNTQNGRFCSKFAHDLLAHAGVFRAARAR